MNRLRRVILFLLVVAAGLSVVMLLAERGTSRPATELIKTVAQGEAQPGAVVIEDTEEPDETVQVSFPEEVEFDIHRKVEVEPGVYDDRVAYTVHMLSGQQAGGEFLAESPTVTFRDEQTGEATGTLRADQARFTMSRQVGGRVTVDPSQLAADRFSLQGNVRGSFPIDDGPPVKLEAGSLQVDGQIVTGPGRVAWFRDDMRLEGIDFTWDNELGRLNYVTDAVVVLEANEERMGVDIFAPGGLTWNFPPDAEDPVAESWGEMRGRVSGLASDGSRFGADAIFVHTSTVTLHGSSVYEQVDDEGARRRVTARRITMRPDDAGVVGFVEADGNVHVVSAPLALLPAWMVSDHVVLKGDAAEAPGEASLTVQDVATSGTDLTWDRIVGRYEYDRDATVDVDPDSDRSIAGLHVEAPGGMTLLVPPGSDAPTEELNGELRGPVVGSLPDGSDFACDILYLDGPTRTYTLDGDSRFKLRDDGEDTEVEAQRIIFETADTGGLALLTADGDVVVLRTPVSMVPVRLATSRLEVTPDSAFSPDEVVWTRGDLTVVGTGMRWDEEQGRVDLERNAIITVHDPDRGVATELTGGGGLTWWVPADARLSFDAGKGELRGPVKGSTSEGSTLETELLYLDRQSGRITLNGPSTVEWKGDEVPLKVKSDEFVVDDFDGEATRVTSSKHVQWERPDVKGRGVGLDWDESTGELRIHEDVELTLLPGQPNQLDVTADGQLTWITPPDGTESGYGELRDRVRGRTSDGDRFVTELLLLDTRTRQVRLVGPSLYERVAEEGQFTLEADRSMRLEVDEQGEARWIEAQGDVDGVFVAPADPDAGLGPVTSRVRGDRLVADRVAREATVYGSACLYEREEGGSTTSLASTESIHVRTGAGSEMEWVEAVRDVVCKTERFEARGQRFVWNVPEDLATLSGDHDQDCRLLWAGAWMRAQHIDLWPEAGRFRINHPTLNVSEIDKQADENP